MSTKATHVGCVFVFDARLHRPSTKTTRVGCVFMFDALRGRFEHENHPRWVHFRVRRASTQAEHENHLRWVRFRGWHPCTHAEHETTSIVMCFRVQHVSCNSCSHFLWVCHPVVLFHFRSGGVLLPPCWLNLSIFGGGVVFPSCVPDNIISPTLCQC